jgi:two-component system phosphate regulon sensor histidine kinase PhoR
MNKKSGPLSFINMPWRFFRKLALLQVVITTLVIITTAFMARHYLKNSMTQQASEHIHESLDLLDKSLFSKGQDALSWCKELETKKLPRFTLINLSGEVLCDNFVNLQKLDNHIDRPEIQNAVESGHGQSKRYSESTQQMMLYEARLITPSSGKTPYILRQSTKLSNLNEAIDFLDQSILILVLPLLIVTSLISLYASVQVSSPLRSLLKKVEHMKKHRNRYSYDSDEETGDEWMLVEKTLDNAQNDLENYINELFLENEKMNTLMESISDSILAVDHEQNILFANDQFRKNFTPQEYKKRDLSDFKIWELVRDKNLQDCFDKTLQMKESFKTRNNLFEIKNGKTKNYFDLKFSPLRNRKGDVFGAVCVFHNVTDRKTAEQLREDFVTNVSHEIRTPLTALKGYVQLLEGLIPTAIDSDESKRLQDCFQRIQGNADRLTHLFSDILTLSVIESKRKVQREWVSTQELTGMTLANIKQNYHDKSMIVKEYYDCKEIHAHPQLIEQVLTNLVDNAYKYTPENGEIHVSWNKTNTHYLLVVEDNGDKIPSQHHARLFERFYRVDPSRSRAQGGTGLGLAIVKHIVQKHYGEIKIDHGPLGGNRFQILIPLGPQKFS